MMTAVDLLGVIDILNVRQLFELKLEAKSGVKSRRQKIQVLGIIQFAN